METHIQIRFDGAFPADEQDIKMRPDTLVLASRIFSTKMGAGKLPLVSNTIKSEESGAPP